MSDMGQMLRRAMMANQGRPTSPMMLNGSPIGRPDAMPGQFPGLLDTISPEKRQGGGYDGDGDSSDTGAMPWWQRLGVLATGGASGEGLQGEPRKSSPQVPPSGGAGIVGGGPQNAPAGTVAPRQAMDFVGNALNRTPPGGVGLLDTLNPIHGAKRFWQDFKSANDRAFGGQPPPSGATGIVGGGPQVPQLATMGSSDVQPVASEPSRPRPLRLGQSIPFLQAGPPPVQSAAALPPPQSPQPQQPPPQGPGQPPPTTQGVPSTSAAGRMGQETGSALDRYFQMMMGLQRQRMLMQMAGGLLGAPTLAEGAGRAFRGGAEALGGQAGPMQNIMGAQAAGQLAAAHPGWNDKDRQAAMLGGLFGGDKFFDKIVNPGIGDYQGGSGKFERTPSGRTIDTGSHLSTWAENMGYIAADGKTPTKDWTQAGKRIINGKEYFLMSDGHMYDPRADSKDEGRLGD